MDSDSRIDIAPRGGDDETIVIAQTDPYLCEVEAMEACVLDGAEPVLSLDKSLDILRTVLALYASARTHTAQRP